MDFLKDLIKDFENSDTNNPVKFILLGILDKIDTCDANSARQSELIVELKKEIDELKNRQSYDKGKAVAFGIILPIILSIIIGLLMKLL